MKCARCGVIFTSSPTPSGVFFFGGASRPEYFSWASRLRTKFSIHGLVQNSMCFDPNAVPCGRHLCTSDTALEARHVVHVCSSIPLANCLSPVRFLVHFSRGVSHSLSASANSCSCISNACISRCVCLAVATAHPSL